MTGSGSIATLPGRKAEVDPANAWEKAICLTPRPNEARIALKRLLTRFASRDRKARGERIDTAQTKEIEVQIDHDTDSRVFFPTRIHVFGPTIRFFVPASFLGGIAKPSWSYVVAVSGADIYQEIDIGAALKITAASPDALMILPIEPGSWVDRFGARWVMGPGIAALIVTCLALQVVSAPEGLIALMIGLGLANALISTPASVLTATSTGPEHRGEALGTYYLASSVGVALAPPLAFGLQAVGGMSLAFAAMCASARLRCLKRCGWPTM